MAKKKLFIAYHGTYDESGSLRKAEEIYKYLTAAGVDCFLFSALANTNDRAFITTPEVAAECEKFLLVCNENIRTDEEGNLLNHGVLQEVRAFAKRIYYNESNDGDARVYGFGQFTSSMANKLHHIFKGVAHFTEIRNGGNNCFEDVLAWVNSESTLESDVITREKDALEDIRSESIRISKRSEYGLSLNTYSENLLPQLEFDGGKKIANILQLQLEKHSTYVLYANGGSGKSYSLKSLWLSLLQSKWLPLYVSVRSAYEKFGSMEHPLYEYLISTYRHFPVTADKLRDFLKDNDAGWVLLLDGYNEAENTDKIQSDLSDIDEYITTVLTTRDKSNVRGLDSNLILNIKLLPLDQKVVKDYIASYNNPQLLPLLSDANMLVMLRNPMLLTMFCNSFDESNYDFHLDSQDLLTPGELIEKCVTAQLRKTDTVNIRTFFTTMCLFPMAVADMYYRNSLLNMMTSRIDLTKAVTSLMGSFDVDSLEAFYLLEYADKWELDITNEEMDELISFLRNKKPLEIRNELTDFERIMSRVLQFFTVDAERSRVGGGIYRFDHQTSLNWYISYGIYIMAELWPERFSEIITEITDNVDITSENTDDYEEQSESIFDFIRDSDTDETYRKFANQLFTRHFAIKTSRLYDIATGCISLYDKADVSDEDYANDVASFCYSLYSLDDRTPASLNENDIVEEYGRKLDQVLKRAARIKDEETKAVTIAKINTIQGALCLGKYRLYNKAHEEKTDEVKQHLTELAKEAEQFQIRALTTREDVIVNGSGRYKNDMRGRIAHSYTSLGTINFYLRDYDKSIEYHKLAYDTRLELSNDESVPDDIRDDSRLRLSINLNRINGSLLQKGNVSADTLNEIFDREILLAETNKIEPEMKAQVRNFAREARLVAGYPDLHDKARDVYMHISDAYGRMFGYQSDALNNIWALLEYYKVKPDVINDYKNEIHRFINSEAFQTIVRIFNDGKELTDIKEINELADHWDYRRKMADGGERQAITTEDPFVNEHREQIISCFRELGMLDEKKDIPLTPDFVLPLGGYGTSNLRRCQLARQTSDRYPDKTLTIVALSSQRPITQKEEIECIACFAPGAQTEFEEMDMAMRNAYELNEVTSEKEHFKNNERKYWKLTSYKSDDPLRSYYNLSAPCNDESRIRANTIDTFNHFLKSFDVKVGSTVFLLSTALYEPYQTYSLLPAAIEYGVRLFFVGGSYKNNDDEILATLCLVDLKSAVNAMYNFTVTYKEQP